MCSQTLRESLKFECRVENCAVHSSRCLIIWSYVVKSITFSGSFWLFAAWNSQFSLWLLLYPQCLYSSSYIPVSCGSCCCCIHTFDVNCMFTFVITVISDFWSTICAQARAPSLFVLLFTVLDFNLCYFNCVSLYRRKKGEIWAWAKSWWSHLLSLQVLNRVGPTDRSDTFIHSI